MVALRALTPGQRGIGHWRDAYLGGQVGHDAGGEVVPPVRKASGQLERLEQEGEGQACGTRFVRQEGPLVRRERPAGRQVIRRPVVLHAASPLFVEYAYGELLRIQ